MPALLGACQVLPPQFIRVQLLAAWYAVANQRPEIVLSLPEPRRLTKGFGVGKGRPRAVATITLDLDQIDRVYWNAAVHFGPVVAEDIVRDVAPKTVADKYDTTVAVDDFVTLLVSLLVEL